MSSFSEEQRKKRVKTGKKSVLCSTPLTEACKLSSPSDSTIHTNSTSSIVIRRRPRHREKTEKKQKPAKAKKQQKKKKRKAGTNRLHDSDDWLTVEEQSDDEKENLKQSARSLTKGLALFQDTASPEQVREAQRFDNYLLESPIRRNRQDDASPVLVDTKDLEKSLPLGNLSHLRTHFDSSDEEELCFKRNSPVKTYPGVRDRRKRKREISIDKSKQWLVDLKVPTATADMLWDQYVREHPEEMREYIAPPTKRQKEKNKKNKSDRGKATEKDNIENWWSKKLWFVPNEPRDKVRTCGRFDTTTRKWSRIVIYPDSQAVGPSYSRNDVYSFPEPKNPKFEVSKARAPRMRLNEYLEKCRARKALDSQAAGPSCSKNKKITVNLDDSSSDSELELATKLYRFKNRQNEREMLSKTVVKSSNEKEKKGARKSSKHKTKQNKSNKRKN